MYIQITEALKGASLLGGICSWLISPSYGMIEESTIEKGLRNYRLNQYKNALCSLPSVERKLSTKHRKELLETALQKISKSFTESGYDLNSLTSEDVDVWVEGAKTGDLASLYNLGWLTQQEFISQYDQNLQALEQLERKTYQAFTYYMFSGVAPYSFRPQYTTEDLFSMLNQNEKIGNFSFLEKAKRQGAVRDMFTFSQGKIEEDIISDILLLEKGEIFYWCQEAHTGKNPQAWIKLALLYAQGQIGEKNPTKSAEWSRKFLKYTLNVSMDITLEYAKESGNEQLIEELSKITEEDIEKEANSSIAILHQRINDSSIPALNSELSAIYLKEFGFLLNQINKTISEEEQKRRNIIREANEREEKARKKAEAIEDEEIAKEYYAAKNYKEALAYFQKAAAKNRAEAQFFLGKMFFFAQGVTQDQAKACEWFLKAAEHGHVNAQFILGVIYASGQGIQKNVNEAVKWLQKAANQGHDKAQEYLKKIYRNVRVEINTESPRNNLGISSNNETPKISDDAKSNSESSSLKEEINDR